jgi:poly(hydroxyalkanoate) depolymerase family esterase
MQQPIDRTFVVAVPSQTSCEQEGPPVFKLRKSNDAFEILKKLKLATCAGAPSAGGEHNHRLNETSRFGANPGQLRMFTYTPSPPAKQPALVVVLHGCGQTAAGYDHGAGWSTLAERYGFALLMPEQQRSNNPNGCFNWFQPEDTERGSGEAASIHQMIETMVRDNGIDPRRVFVTGLSAGGAMTSVMLACYPETFAAGAIIAGLPYGAASNVQQAFQSMFQCPSRPAKEWGDLVRAAAPRHGGSWPRVSVWHGNADKTVIPPNAREIIKQWTDVHGLSDAPSMEDMVEGYPREAWLNDAGEELVESYTITDMAHGTPLATGNADFECGAAGPFLLEVGISSSYHIAKFFGLTQNGARPRKSASRPSATPAPATKTSELMQPQISQGEILNGEILDRPDVIPPPPPRAPINIGAVITKALESAGLIPRG